MPAVRDKTTDELSKRLSVTKRQARRLRDRGITAENLSLIEAAKLRKLDLEGSKLEEQLAILRRDHVPAAEVIELGMKLGGMISELCGSCISNWPSELAGRSEIQIRETITRSFDVFIEQFRATAKQI